MTEAEWLKGKDSMLMLDFLWNGSSARKLRLFACGCCRLAYPHLSHKSSRKAVDVAEQFADGLASGKERHSARTGATKAFDAFSRTVTAHDDPRLYEYTAPRCVLDPEAIMAAINTAKCCRLAPRYKSLKAADPVIRNAILDIFGNPFRPVVFSPSWRTDITRALAAQMYDSRDFSAMPILADALQDAGCNNTDILNHCRDTNAAHIRGCWAVDLVLGKE